jgi:hypothetical protein
MSSAVTAKFLIESSLFEVEQKFTGRDGLTSAKAKAKAKRTLRG